MNASPSASTISAAIRLATIRPRDGPGGRSGGGGAGVTGAVLLDHVR